MKNILKFFLWSLIFLGFVFVSWELIRFTYNSILKLPIFLDDWVMIWGVAHQKGILFDPTRVQFYFDEFPNNYALRAGYVQVWLTALLYHTAHLNHYWYLYTGLILKLFVSVSIFISVYFITKSIPASIFSGFLYAINPLGSQSLTWFINYGIYIFLGFFIFSLPIFVKSASGQTKYIFLSLAIMVFLLYIYSERAFLLVGVVPLFFIWHDKIFGKKQIALAVITMITLVVSYRLLFSNASGGSEAVRILGRIGLGNTNLSQGKFMFLTYPINIISLSIIPGSLLNKLLYIHNQIPFFRHLPITEFRFWDMLVFPPFWIGSVLFVSNRANLSKKGKLFWIFTGLLWAVINIFLRTSVFRLDWEWSYHFLFISSIYLVLATLMLFFSLRRTRIYGAYVKTLLTSLIFILIGYSLTWVVDPLIPPGSYNADRYITLSAAFGTIFMGTFLGMITLFILRHKSLFFKSTGTLLVIYTFVTMLKGSIKDSQYYIDALLIRRSQITTNKVLSYISNRLSLRANSRSLLLIEPWDIFEVVGILPPGGHSIELTMGDLDPEKLPLIYFEEKSFENKFQELCPREKVNQSGLYKFRVKQNGDVQDLTNTLPKLDCQSLPTSSI